MKLSLLSLCFAVLGMALVFLPGSEGLFFRDELHARLDAMQDAYSRASGSSRGSPFPVGRNLDRPGGIPSIGKGFPVGHSLDTLPLRRPSFGDGISEGFGSMGTVGMRSSKAKGKFIKDIFKKLSKMARKKAEEERKKPETHDPQDLLDIINNNNDRDSGSDRRDPIDSMGAFGRERKIPGTTGREIEGAFQGDTGKVVKQVSSGRNKDSRRDRGDRRGGIDRSNRREGRTHRERGSTGRSIEN